MGSTKNAVNEINKELGKIKEKIKISYEKMVSKRIEEEVRKSTQEQIMMLKQRGI